MKKLLSIFLFIIGGFFLIRGAFGLIFSLWNISRMADTSLSEGLAALTLGSLRHARNMAIVRTAVGAIITYAGFEIKKR